LTFRPFNTTVSHITENRETRRQPGNVETDRSIDNTPESVYRFRSNNSIPPPPKADQQQVDLGREINTHQSNLNDSHARLKNATSHLTSVLPTSDPNPDVSSNFNHYNSKPPLPPSYTNPHESQSSIATVRSGIPSSSLSASRTAVSNFNIRPFYASSPTRAPGELTETGFSRLLPQTRSALDSSQNQPTYIISKSHNSVIGPEKKSRNGCNETTRSSEENHVKQTVLDHKRTLEVDRSSEKQNDDHSKDISVKVVSSPQREIKKDISQGNQCTRLPFNNNPTVTLLRINRGKSYLFV